MPCPNHFLTVALLLAAVAQAQHKIAFTANVDGNWDLYVANDDGSGLLRLTRTPLDERAPALSPDAARVAYSTSDGALRVMTIATKESQKLDLPAGWYNHPRWSPDASELLYTSYRFAKNAESAELESWLLREKRRRVLIRQEGVCDYGAYAGDGARIVYTSTVAAAVADAGISVIQSLWLASLVEGRTRPLLLAAGMDSEPAWSPDGKRVVFVSDRGGGMRLWLLEMEGGALAQLSHGDAAESGPRWSPDGERIVFVAAEAGREALRVMEWRTRAVRKLSPFGERAVAVRAPDWR